MLLADARDNCYELLEGICRSADMSEGKRLNYLNSFVKLVVHVNGNLASLGFSVEDILRWLVLVECMPSSNG